MRFVTTLLALFVAAICWADDPALITGRITIFGSKIEVSPAVLETAAGIPIFLNTTGQGLSGKLKGELRGPGINGAITFQTDPGTPFQLPALQTKGTYYFEDIRLENNGQILASATPNHVEIHVIDILVTQISSRPLSLEEIRSLGIVINENDYTAVSFEIGLEFNSQQIPITFPLLIPKKAGLPTLMPPSVQSAQLGSNLTGMLPETTGVGGIPEFIPVTFAPDRPEFGVSLPDIPGIIVIPNNIAFLNQFFSVLLMVTNGASPGSNLTVDHLNAQVVFDPANLKLAKTNPSVPLGSAVPVRVPGPDNQIGTADDLTLIIATNTAKAEFFVEGLNEGTHTVRMNLTGTLHGLAQGDLSITGSATGAVLVRNPNFSVTFSHPSVVRAYQPYDLFVTVTNTSNADANLVRLTLPSNELVNCIVLGNGYQDFEMIRSGESATATFRIEPHITGQVTTAVITSSNNVKGQFALRVAVGEKGIPLSPNTLLLPEVANHLGPELLQKALNVLGLAYSAATAPPGSLPAGIPYISKAIVTERAIEFAQAGQRFQLGEPKSEALSHLLLDWLGNQVANDAFLNLLETSQSGKEFLNELFSQLNIGASNAITFHNSFAQTTYYRKRFLSVMLSSSSSPAGLSIVDSTGAFPADRFASADGLAQWAVIGDLPDSHDDTLRITGNGGTTDLSIIVPIGSIFYTAQTTLSTGSGKSYEVFFNNSLAPPNLQIKDEHGAISIIPLIQVQANSPAIISAIQDSNVSKTGNVVAILFNQPVTKNTAENPANYSVARNHVIDAKLQAGSRIEYLSFQNPISPFVDNDLSVSGIQAATGAGSVQQTIRIQTTVTTEAGRVTGRFLSSYGVPIPSATVTLTETDEDDLFGEKTLHTTAITTTNAQGEFTFDYVRKLTDPFQISAQDPLTGDIGTASSIVTFSNQFIRLDVVLLARGTVKGKVFKAVNGSNLPVPNAIVTAISSSEAVGREVLTDANGNYLIDRVAVGTVNLNARNQNVSDPQKFFGATSATVPLAGSIVSKDIEVTTTQPGSVKGRVLQSNGTDPIVGAYVLLSIGDVPASAVFSDSQGWFHFDQVPPGLILLTATDTASGTTIGSANLTLAAGGNQTVNIVASGSGSIEAIVALASGMSLSDIVVGIQGTALSQRLSVNNTAIFNGVPVGSWQVFANNTRTGELISSSARISYASSTVTVFLKFQERGTISGNVKTINGQAAPESTVLLFGGPYLENLYKVEIADSAGHYHFKDLVMGKYAIHAISADQNDGGQGPSVELSASLRNANSDVTFLGTGTITVHVETSSGPAMATVKLSTSTFDFDGRIIREITYSKTSDPTTGNAVFNNIFRLPFTAEASTALTLPARFGGNLTGPTATFNLLLSNNPNISGIVHDANGNPVQAQVTYSGGAAPQTLTTAPDGTFTFNRASLGYAIFTAAYGSTKGELQTQILPINDPIDIHLLGAGSVHGMVKDEDGSPVAGVNLKLVVSGLLARTLQGVSAPDGTYRFNAVPEGRFTIEATNGVTGGRAGSSIIHNSDIPLDIILSGTGTVQGTVFQSDGLTRVVAAEVYIRRIGDSFAIGTVTTDGNGNYLLAHVPVSHSSGDTYQLTAFSKSTGRSATSTQFVITSNGQIINQNLILEGLGTVSGIVFDYTGINPISGSLLTLESKGITTQTLHASSGSQGDYQFAGVPQGAYTLTAQKDLLAGQVTGSITHDGEQKTQNVLLQPAAQIRGVVTFFDGAQVPAGVNPVVTVQGLGITRFVDAPDGNFLIQDLPFGTFSLTTNFTYANKPYRGRTQVALSSPGEAFATLKLKGLNTLNLTVTGFVSNQMNSITLTYSNDLETRSESTAIPANGIVQFLNVPESKFTVFAQSGDLLSGSASGTFTGDGETRNLSITLTSSGTVQGTIYRNSTPAPNVSITIKGLAYELYAYTDGAGQFHVPGVPIGAYTISAEDILLGGKARETGSIDFENDINTHQLNLDLVRPSVVSTNPANGQPAVPNGNTIHVVFSEPMDPVSTQAAFALTYNGGQATGTVSVSGNELIFTPSTGLQSQLTYNIVLLSTAQDLAGNNLAADFVASFTSVDTTPPTVNTSIPLNLAFNVPLNTKLQLFFNETIVNLGNYSITRASGLPVPAATQTWNSAHTSLTLTFATSFVESERVTFTITGYSDSAGNVQTGATSIAFDMIDTVPPTAPVLASSDADNTIREGAPLTILAAVSEPLVNVDFYVNGVLKFHDTAAPYEYIVPASLTSISSNGSNHLTFSAKASDRSGNVSGVSTPLTITLIPDSPPQINISSNPAPGVVYVGSQINVTYNASDDGAISKVLIIVTGANNQTFDMGSANSTSQIVTVTTAPEGSSLFIKAQATDDTGKSITTSDLVFTIQKDTTPPSVNLTSPPGGSMSANGGNPFTVSADVTDNVQVTQVEFTFNGLTVLDTTAPYSTDFTAPAVSDDTSYPGTVKAYDLEGNTTVVDFTIIVKPLLPLPGHYVKHYGDASFQMSPIPSTPRAWSVWGPVDLKYYSNILFTYFSAICCHDTPPVGSSLYLAYSTNLVTWTQFFSWDLPSHTVGYFDNYFALSTAAQNAGPVYIGFFSTGGDNQAHTIFPGNVGIKLEGYSNLNAVYQFQASGYDAVYPFLETEWPGSISRIRYDLSNFSRIRFQVGGTNTNVTNAQLTFQYFDVPSATWKYVGGGTGTWINLNDSAAQSPWIDLEPSNKTDALLRMVVRNGDGIVKSTNGKFLILELQSSSDYSRLLISSYLPGYLGNPDGTKIWTDMPSSETRLMDVNDLGATEARIPAANASQVRFRTNVTVPGTPTAKLRLKYWNGSSWQSFSGTNPEISLSTTGEKVSAWIDVPAAAKQNALRLQVYGLGGDFQADPRFTGPQFEFRGPLEQRTP